MRCSDCKSRKYCDNADKVNYCAGYIFDDSKPKMQTNEEWLHTLKTEQLAEWLALKRKLIRIPETNYEVWMRWLKEKHE